MADYQLVVRTALPIKIRKIIGSVMLPLLVSCTRAGEFVTFDIPLKGDSLQTTFQGLYDATKLPPSGKTPHVPVVIVPHHLTAAVTIAAGISSLQEQHPLSILLLSPDHFHACKNFFCTGTIQFKSSLGESEPDLKVLTALHTEPLVSEQKDMFHREHGIYTIIPFITRLLPGTKVTPLTASIRPDWKSHREELLTIVHRALEQNAVLVISSDFSHYLPLIEADSADERTAKVLFSRDFDGMASLENPAQSDCPACLWIAARIADESDAYNPSVLLHTNSARLLHEEAIPSTTSHFAIAFYRNASLTSKDTAFAGDVTMTRATSGSILLPPKGVRTFWRGTGPRIVNLEGPLQERCPQQANEFVFCNLLSLWKRAQPLAMYWGIENNHKLDQGIEGYRQTQLLLGQGGAVPLSEEGTMLEGMRVFALTNIMNPVPAEAKADLEGQYRRVIRALRTGSSSTLPSVVFVHTGTEYKALLSKQEQNYLRSFVDHGAKAIIAVHSHVPSDMEIYKGVPIFHGLGNFVFDQADTNETATAKVVRLRLGGNGLLFDTLTSK